MTREALAWALLSGLGILGGIGMGVKAFLDRRGLTAKAESDEASATAVITAAARELVDPLRKELALERREHAAEVAASRKEVRALSKDLTECRSQVSKLRDELAAAWAENERLRARVVELEIFHGD